MSTPAKLFINAICPFAQRAWIAARLKNAPVALEHVSLSDMPQSYIDNINPRATVPALISAEGRPVYESMFIAEYLDAQYGRPYDLFPRNSQVRADIRFFLDEAGNVVGSLYDTLRSDDASLKANQDELRGGLAKVEALLVKQSSGPFFLGAQVSLADVGVLPFLIRFNPILKHYKNIDLLAETPRLKALFEAGVQLDAVASTSPSVAHILKTYGSYAGHPLRVEVELPTLYTSLGCPFAQRARLAQAITKVPLKRVEIDLQNRPANFQELNPRNTVPFIIQPNGQKVFESLFIVKYLGEQRNDATNFLETEGSAIIPSTAQGVHDADFFVDDFPSSVLFEVITVGGEGRPKAVENAKSALATFEKRVKGPFALGAQVSFADIAVVPFLLRFEALTKLANVDVLVAAPKLQALLAAFRAIDGVAAEIETADYYATGLKGYYKE